LDPFNAEKLAAIGNYNSKKLLEEGASKTGRKKIAEASGIDESKILKWVNMADLFRIKGLGQQFSELLEAAGVDTVKELRNRNAENLHAKLMEIQEQKKLTKAVPALSQVADFIEQAKGLEPMVTY
jgi:hypothetical protein